MTKQLRGGDNNHDEVYTAQKMNYSTKGFFSKCDQIHIFFADLTTFTEEILNRKVHLLCSAICCLMHCSLFNTFRSFLYSDRIWTREFSFLAVLCRKSGHI